MEKKKESVLLSLGEERIVGWGVHHKKIDRGGIVKRDIDPYIVRVGIKRKERE